jgi:hypothetical protein
MPVYYLLAAPLTLALTLSVPCHADKLQPEIICRSDNAIVCQQANTQLFASIPDIYPTLKYVLANAAQYQLQIQYTQIIRDKSQVPQLISYRLGVDDQQYHYPASTVKLPVAALALEWLEQQEAPLDVGTTWHTFASRESQVEVTKDSDAIDQRPTLQHYIQQVLMVSDNPGFNRMYELLGQDHINQQLRSKGLSSATINHRLSMPMSAEENRHFNPMAFVNPQGEALLELPARYNTINYPNTLAPLLGQRYYEAGKLIEQPMDFTDKNRLSIVDLSGVIERLIFPQLFSLEHQFHINETHRELLLRYMAMFPSESQQPDYASKDIADNRYKYVKFGGTAQSIPTQQRWLNKIGSAYGFLTDAGYFVDLQHNLEFFVTATVYVNDNETLNDDTYEYQQIGLPFHRELGEYLYHYELNRARSVSPDLSFWQQLIGDFAE